MPLEINSEQRAIAHEILAKNSSRSLDQIIEDLNGMTQDICGGEHEIKGSGRPEVAYCASRERNLACLHPLSNSGGYSSAALRLKDYMKLAQKIALAAGIMLDPASDTKVIETVANDDEFDILAPPPERVPTLEDKFNASASGLTEVDRFAVASYRGLHTPSGAPVTKAQREVMRRQHKAKEGMFETHEQVSDFFQALSDAPDKDKSDKDKPSSNGRIALPVINGNRGGFSL